MHDRDQAMAAALDVLIVESRAKVDAPSGTDLARGAEPA
jgi:dihydrodipicolinate reductase